MRVLIVEDDLITRQIMQAFLSQYGICDVAVDGREALRLFRSAHGENKPYDLICLDIMMPVMNGQEVLKQIREIEADNGIHGTSGVKIIMTTALGDKDSVLEAFREQCEGYLVKPIVKEDLDEAIQALGFAKQR